MSAPVMPAGLTLEQMSEQVQQYEHAADTADTLLTKARAQLAEAVIAARPGVFEVGAIVEWSKRYGKTQGKPMKGRVLSRRLDSSYMAATDLLRARIIYTLALFKADGAEGRVQADLGRWESAPVPTRAQVQP